MKQSITKSDFRDAFKQMGRQDNFSYEGLGHLYDALLEYEESCGQEIELDVIALCCEYEEEAIEDALDKYNLKSLDQLKYSTLVLWHNETDVIYQQY